MQDFEWKGRADERWGSEREMQYFNFILKVLHGSGLWGMASQAKLEPMVGLIRSAGCFPS